MIVDMDGNVLYDGAFQHVWLTDPVEIEIQGDKPLIHADDVVAIEVSTDTGVRRWVGLVTSVRRAQPFSDEWYTVVGVDVVEW